MTKAFVLGAGLGTRLRPLTDALPKPLIPVFHRPLIQYALDHCLAAGIREFAINTHHLPEKWPEYFPDGTYRGAPVTFFHEPELLETGGGIKNIASWIGDDPVLVYNGDILTDLDLPRLLETHTSSPPHRHPRPALERFRPSTSRSRTREFVTFTTSSKSHPDPTSSPGSTASIRPSSTSSHPQRESLRHPRLPRTRPHALPRRLDP